MRRTIGIDLGTTNSCVATLDARGTPQILANRQGQRTTPSVASFLRDRILVGAPAKRNVVAAPRETVFGVKRLIGRRYDDPEIQRLARTLPYQLAPSPNGDAWVQMDGRLISPQECSAHVLDLLRQVAEEQLGGTVEEAIITVPAYFDDAQRQATKDAAEIGGLKVRRLLNEPTAAALGYGAHKSPASRIAVCDLGGGTFDVSIVNVEDGVFEVVSTFGDIMLGGDDLDRRIVERLCGEIHASHGIDLSGDPTALGRIREESERLKQALSDLTEVTVQIPYLAQVAGKPLDFSRTVTRPELEAWTEDLVGRVGSSRVDLQACKLEYSIVSPK